MWHAKSSPSYTSYCGQFNRHLIRLMGSTPPGVTKLYESERLPNLAALFLIIILIIKT